jgi:DNA-directed RNA polymerase I, II, and III subunit RPABC4
MSSQSAYQAPSGAVPITGYNTASYNAATEGPVINYLCGDCNSKVTLKKGDPIRCRDCGHRVLYKERTKR